MAIYGADKAHQLIGPTFLLCSVLANETPQDKSSTGLLRSASAAATWNGHPSHFSFDDDDDVQRPALGWKSAALERAWRGHCAPSAQRSDGHRRRGARMDGSLSRGKGEAVARPGPADRPGSRRRYFSPSVSGRWFGPASSPFPFPVLIMRTDSDKNRRSRPAHRIVVATDRIWGLQKTRTHQSLLFSTATRLSPEDRIYSHTKLYFVLSIILFVE